MRSAASDIGTKALAVLILLAAAWVLFKVVLGVVTFVAWIVVIAAAVLAVGWALTRLL
jgi:hypothetical protein